MDTEKKEKLVEIISNIFRKSNDKVFLKKVEEQIVCEGRFTKKQFNDFIIYQTSINYLVPEELLWITQAIEKANPKKIKTLDFFTDIEIKNYKNFVNDDKIDIIKISELRILKNVFKLYENQWTTVKSVEEIALMLKNNIIRADYNFQRQSKAVGKFAELESTEILRKIYVNRTRVKEIEESIVDESYNFNTIRLNLMDDGIGKPIIVDNTIVIPEDGDCIIPDGNHRCIAAERAYFNHPELKTQFQNQYFQVIFTFYTPRKVKQMITQEWKVEKVNGKHISAMKENFSNLIVDEIKRSEKSESVYADKIVTTGIEIREHKGFILYSFLSDAINRNYDSNSFVLKSQALTLANWIIEFYNYLSILMIDDFLNYKNISKTKWSTNQYVVYGFIYLSSILKDDINWKEKLKNIIEKINWNKDFSPEFNNNANKNILKVEEKFAKESGNYNV